MQGSSPHPSSRPSAAVFKAGVIAIIASLILTCGKKQEKIIPTKIDRSPARAVLVVGSVFVMNRSEGPKARWRKVRIGTAIHVNDMIRTGNESKVDITIASEKKLTLGENTLININFNADKPDEDLRVVVAFGQLFGNIKKIVGDGSKENFFATPTATATIRGTVFEIVVAKLTGECAVKVVKGLVAVRKRVARKVFKADASSPSAQQLQQVDLNNADNLTSFLNIIGLDEGAAKREKLRKEIAAQNEKLRQAALGRGYSPQEIEMMIARQTKTLREKAGDSEPEEIMVKAGHQAQISYTRSGIQVSQLGVKELGFLFRLYGEDRLKEALASADLVNRPAGMAEPMD